MFTMVAGGIGDRLIRGSMVDIMVPAGVYWGSGLAVIKWNGDIPYVGWGFVNLLADDQAWLKALIARLFRLTAPGQFVLMIGVVVLSALAIDQLVCPVLRWSEGYWPKRLEGLRQWFIARRAWQLSRERLLLESLAGNYEHHDVLTRRKYRKLSRRIEMQTPASELDLAPTELGNILRAAETRPKDKYGMDAIFCWPRLWLILPESAKSPLIDANTRLESAIRHGVWGSLFAVWSLWAWWTIIIAAVVVLFSYRKTLAHAVKYGNYFESAYDLYRMEIYKAVGWREPPEDRQADIEEGEKLTRYLRRRPQNIALTKQRGNVKESDSPFIADDPA